MGVTNKDIIKALEALASKGDQDAQFTVTQGIESKLSDLLVKGISTLSIENELRLHKDAIEAMEDRIGFLIDVIDKMDGGLGYVRTEIEGAYKGHISILDGIKKLRSDITTLSSRESKEINVEAIIDPSMLSSLSDKLDMIISSIDTLRDFKETATNQLGSISRDLELLCTGNKEAPLHPEGESPKLEPIKLMDFKMSNFHQGEDVAFSINFGEDISEDIIKLILFPRSIPLFGSYSCLSREGVGDTANFIIPSKDTAKFPAEPHKYQISREHNGLKKVVCGGKVNVLSMLGGGERDV